MLKFEYINREYIENPLMFINMFFTSQIKDYGIFPQFKY